MNIVEGFHDPSVFGGLEDIRISPDTWGNWIVLLKAIFALPMDAEEFEVFKKFTGRTKPPEKPFREVYVISGRKSGKSILSSIILCHMAIFGEWQVGSQVPHFLCLAGDRKQAGIVHHYCRKILSLPYFSGMIRQELKTEIELTNDSMIAIHTADYRALRGYVSPMVVLDECAFLRRFGLNDDIEIVRALRPSLLAVRDSLLMVISSPFSKQGLLWSAYEKYHGKDDERCLCWQSSTLDMNPRFDAAEIAAEFERDPVSARSEWDAIFRSDLSSYCSVEVADACIEWGRFELAPMKDVAYVGFCDPSSGRNDKMVLCLAHEEGDMVVQDLLCVKHPPFSPLEAVREFAGIVKKYGIKKIVGDRYSIGFVVGLFQNEGIVYETSELSKSDIFLETLPLFNTGKIRMLDHKEQKRELISLERRSGRNKDVIDHPPSGSDDTINAACGAAYICSKAKEDAGGLVVGPYTAREWLDGGQYERSPQRHTELDEDNPFHNWVLHSRIGDKGEDDE